MTGTRASWFSSWWARLFGRRSAARATTSASLPPDSAANQPSNPPEPAPAAHTEAVPAPRSAKAARLEADAAQSLLETLQLDALPLAATRTPPGDPGVRQRTLEALADLRNIPALQSLVQGFMRALNRPEVSIDEVVETIEKDSALCVRVLRMANSVLVSPERRIEDLETAVQMLGVARVRKAAQALFTLRDANRVADGFDWRHLWMHALATAAIAEELEQQFRSSGDSQIYLAALLHDVGKIVLSTVAAEVYRDILVTAWNDGGRLEDLERARLGVDHREAGVLFAEHAGLPAVVIAAIGHHDRPERAENFRFEVAVIALANHVSKAHGLGFSGARIEASEADFETLPAWAVIEETCGWRPNAESVEQELNGFVTLVREDLWALKESA